MNKEAQIDKANLFKQLHNSEDPLVLPNIWDPFGAQLLQHIGFSAAATASAAISSSLGLGDGQELSFETLLESLSRIANSVSIPISADIERGYAESEAQLSENIGRLIEAGIIGINIEDSLTEGGELRPKEEQVSRISTIREAADSCGVPLFINARCDCFLNRSPDAIEIATERGKAYKAAGADCFYPVLLNDLDGLEEVQNKVPLPINVLASVSSPSREKLARLGIERISLGPSFFRSAAFQMKRIASSLLAGEEWNCFLDETLSGDEITFYRNAN